MRKEAWEVTNKLDTKTIPRRQTQPLRDTDIREPWRLQHLQQDDLLTARVLDIMRERHGDVADVARAVIERLARHWRLVDGDPRRARDEEVPLVALRVPVQFAHRAGSQRDERGGNIGRRGEGGRVDDADAAGAGDREGFLLREVVRVLRLGLVIDPGGTGVVLLGDVQGGRGARKKVPGFGIVGFGRLCKMLGRGRGTYSWS